MRLVLDTNVVVSALFWNGNERRVLEACVEGSHAMVSALLAEAERILLQKFSYPKPDTAAFLRMVVRAADLVAPGESLRVVSADPDDDRVLECAIAGRADRIVTGDKHLLALRAFRGIGIVRPADALREARQS
jgi:uncharacterized protein